LEGPPASVRDRDLDFALDTFACFGMEASPRLPFPAIHVAWCAGQLSPSVAIRSREAAQALTRPWL